MKAGEKANGRVDDRLRQQAAVAEFGHEALVEDDLEGLMAWAAELVARSLDMQYSSVLELQPDGETLLARAGFGWTKEILGKQTVSAGSDTQAGLTLSTGKPVIVDDMAGETRFKVPPLFIEKGLVSGLSVIIYGKERPYGVMGAHCTARRIFTGEDVSFVQSVANVLGAAIQRRRSEDAQHTAEARYRSIVENAIGGIFQSSIDGRMVFANQAFADFLGYESPQELMESITDVASQIYDDPEQRAEFIELMRKQGRVSGYEVRARRRDGSIMIGSTNVWTVLNDEGEPAGFQGFVEDITERRRIEEAIRDSEARHRLLLRNIDEIFYIVDTSEDPYKGNVTFVSDQVENITGYKPREFMEDSSVWFGNIHPDDVQSVTGTTMKMYADKQGLTRFYRFKHKANDEYRWIEDRVVPSLDENGDVSGFFGVARDVTERKQSENALLNSEARLLEAQRIAHVGSWEWDVMTEELTWTDELYRIFGFDPSEPEDLYARFIDAIHTEDRARFKKTLREDLEHGEARDMDYRIIRIDGAERVVSSSAKIISADTDAGRTPVKLIGTIQDITEQNRIEQEMQLLQTITLAVSETSDINAALRVTLERVCDLTGWSLGESWLPDSSGEQLESGSTWHNNAPGMEEFIEASSQFVFPYGAGLPGRAWASKRPEWMADVTTNGKFLRAQMAKKAGLKAGLAIPVLMNDEVVAVMDFFIHEPRGKDRKLIDLISGVAAQLGSVIVSKRSEERAKDYNMLLNAISRTLLNYVSGTGAGKVFEELLYRVLFLTNSNLGFIGDVEYEDGKKFMTMRAFNTIFGGTGMAKDGHWIGSRIEVTEDVSLVDRVFSDEGPVIANDLGDAGEKLAPFFGGNTPSSNFLGIPLMHDNIIMGVIGIADRKTGYEEGLVEFLKPLVVTCANVLEADHNDDRRLLAEKNMAESLQTIKKTLEGVVQALASTAESRDPYTAGHQQRVSQLAVDLAREMGLPKDRIEGLRVTGLLHDLGKMAVPVEILSKPGRINEHEFSIIKTHSQVGYDILERVSFPWPVATTVYQHHERLDGSGYPLGLKGDEISQEARILGVADVVEAISSHRPYRAAKGIETALEEIYNRNGELYDPDVVEACLKLFREKGYKLE